MKAPASGRVEYEALFELAESKFHAWHQKKLRPERERRMSELRTHNLTTSGRAVAVMRIYRELLEREVRKRIGFYAAVARESGSSEMLSKRRLDEFRELVMTRVGHATRVLKDHIMQDALAAGDVPLLALPNERQYVSLKAVILDVVNDELRVLAAEGTLASRSKERGVVSEEPAARRAPKVVGARATIVAPILDSKGWSIFEWATNASVDFHTASDYLKGRTKPHPSSRKKLAEALGVKVEDLPV